MQKIGEGSITDRKDVLRALESDLGYLWRELPQLNQY